MKISVLIPCYNEAATIERLLRSVVKASERLPLEIIVVNDGSTDGTDRLLRQFARDNEITVLNHSENRGKGAALKTAIRTMSGEIAITQDSDLEYSPTDYGELIRPIHENRADIVGGVRFNTDLRHRYRGHHWFNKLISTAVSRATGVTVTDALSGLKAFNAVRLKHTSLRERRFGIEIELLCKTTMHTGRYVEVPIHYRPRSYRQGKKISPLDAFHILRAAWRYT